MVIVPLPAEIKLHFLWERHFSIERRARVAGYLERLLLAVLLFSLVLPFWGGDTYRSAADLFLGLALLLAAAWLVLTASLAFSRYQVTSLWLKNHRLRPGLDYLAAAVLSQPETGLLRQWFASSWRRELEWRLGLEAVSFEPLLAEAEPPAPTDTDSLFTTLWQSYPAYAEYLSRQGITFDDWLGAGRFLVQRAMDRYFRRAWWRWEYLSAIPGLAKDWHYGETYRLGRYGSFLTPAGEGVWEETLAVERVLQRQREANVILIGERGAALAVAEDLAARISAGATPPRLEGKRVFLLQTGRLLANFEHQPGLPEEVLALIQEAALAGHIILVIDDLPRLVSYLSRLGTPLSTLLDDYLAGSVLVVIGLADPASFHGILEPDAVLMNRFETVSIERPPEERFYRLAGEEAARWEEKTPLIFTYQAVRAAADGVKNYFAAGSAMEEIADLFAELTPSLLVHGHKVVSKDDVLDFLRQKTKVPLGRINETERETLLSLEQKLKERVIGQDRALVLLSGALRRARTAIRNIDRPVGTFLFLGPTGVGKTETAKAVAAIQFGREDALLRLDMSEYASPGSLERLIGSLDNQTPGILAKMVREQPYGVLLLDEFEKTNREVLNLFLQIFDEGVFSDYQGRPVNLRSLLIIATSNAGAEIIWELLKTKPDLAGEERYLTDQLVKAGRFSPELLNRFDAIVLFEPLGPAALEQIATLQLRKLSARLAKQGVRLEITPFLAAAVAERGANRQFGARPMQRFIQETVEEVIARAILDGRLKAGQTATFVPSREAGSNLLGANLRVE